MDECDSQEQFDYNETENELKQIKIIRPLEIGLERLPEGVTALDFITYKPVRSVKTFKYEPENVPRHPLFGNAAVPSRDLVEMKLKPHSKFYKQVFKEKYDKSSSKPPERSEEDDFIPWHLVTEPENSSSYDRYEIKQQSYLKGVDRNTVYEKIKSGEPLPLIAGLDKLMTTVDWLNPLGEEDNATNSKRERNIQDKLHGFLKKIKTEDIRNKVAVWQKFLANASSRFKLDSFSSVDEGSSGSAVQPDGKDQQDDSNEDNHNLASDDVCTPSDTGTCILVAEKSVQMEEPLTNGRPSTEVKLLETPEELVPRNKSPVQQWVDSLPSEESIVKVDDILVHAEPNDAEVEGFTLGAEAVGVTSPRPYPYVQITNTCGGSDAGSHCSSMESLLESRRPDPEEVLLELGFGGSEEPDTVSRIPSRFLQPSALKGVVIEDFLKHEQLLGHTFTSGFSGYRGLSGPLNTMPSGIVGKIMERLREAEVGRNNNRHHIMTQHHKLNQSVLSPDNRKWLERQGVSPEPEGRRIILGEKAFVLAKDGGIVEGSSKKGGDSLNKGEELEKTESDKDHNNDNSRETDDDINNNDRNSDDGTSSGFDDDGLKPQYSRMASLDNEQLEIEYKTIALLATQLKGSDIAVDIVVEEDFYKLTTEERKRVERAIIENALYTYQRRLRDLDLRCHLKELLASEADRVSNILGRQDQEWINIARQMTTLLRHQETLRQELRFTKNTYGKS